MCARGKLSVLRWMITAGSSPHHAKGYFGVPYSHGSLVKVRPRCGRLLLVVGRTLGRLTVVYAMRSTAMEGRRLCVPIERVRERREILSSMAALFFYTRAVGPDGICRSTLVGFQIPRFKKCDRTKGGAPRYSTLVVATSHSESGPELPKPGGSILLLRSLMVRHRAE